MDISVIIVNWNSRDYVRKCVASIRRHTKRLRYEIIVIDAASFDGVDRMLEREDPAVVFIQSPSNEGFAKANNRAFAESRGEVILFLNPDTELVGPAIEEMYQAVRRLPHAGAVGCRLLNSNGTLQSTCVRATPTILNKVLDSHVLRTKWPRSFLWGKATLYEDGKHLRIVDAICGACVMVERSRFVEVGGFSEDYFMYAEDMDLSYKLQKAGYHNYHVPHATVVHHGGSSSRQAENVFAAVMLPEATWRFLRKTRGKCYAGAYRVAMFVSAIGRLTVLAVAAPWIRDGRNTRRLRSVRKWRAVLRWAVNQDDMVKQYYDRNAPRAR